MMVMSRFRKHVIGILAAATVAAAGLTAPQPAAAMPWSCATRHTLYNLYMSVGDAFDLAHEYEYAAYWYGKADGVLGGC
jgi:hypothetical protein